jgi:outer membrane lipoprotein SlyB
MLKAFLLTGAMLLSACASTTSETQVRYGRVEQIQTVMVDGDHQFGIGTVVGVVAGGLIGNQIGSGSGRAVATAAGAVAGGAIGNKIENKNDQREGQQVVVRLEDGASVAITQPGGSGLRVGDRVRIDGSGSKTRVVRY